MPDIPAIAPDLALFEICEIASSAIHAARVSDDGPIPELFGVCEMIKDHIIAKHAPKGLGDWSPTTDRTLAWLLAAARAHHIEPALN